MSGSRVWVHDLTHHGLNFMATNKMFMSLWFKNYTLSIIDVHDDEKKIQSQLHSGEHILFMVMTKRQIL